MSKDYYKILGINEFESAENIKSAYRKLARKWHPDVAGNSSEALKMFKEINEAYEILSNRVKKEEYDRARRFYNYAKGNYTEEKTNNENNKVNKEERKTTTKPNFSFNWEDFIAKRQQNKKEEKQPIKGSNIYTDIEITVLEAITGTMKVVNMLKNETCPKCGGKKFANGTICKHCNGKGEVSSYKKFNIKIPAGIKNTSKIRLSGEGNNGKFGGPNGDLIITVNIKESPIYKTDGLNILKKVPISPCEAVLGSNIKIDTINGTVSLKISPNTQNGQKIRLSGCGISQNNSVGDMIVTIEINIPKNLSVEELNLYKKLAEISTGNVRENIYDR